MNGMNFAQVAFKMSHVAMLTAALSLVGCGGGGGGVAAGVNAIGGVAQKGPFVINSTVTACQLTAASNYQTCGTTLQTKTTDALGTYSLNATWGGLTKVTITGNYVSEKTGTVVGPDTVSAIIDLPAPAAGATTPVKANPNAVTTIAAQLAQTQIAAAPAGTLPAVVLAAATGSVVSALGLPAGTDPTQLDVTKDPALLVVSAAILDAQAVAGGSLATLATNLATDISGGLPLGQSAGIATGAGGTIDTALTNYSGGGATTLVNNLTNGLKTSGGATAAAAVTVTNQTVAAAATTTATTAQTTVKGLTFAADKFTVGNNLAATIVSTAPNIGFINPPQTTTAALLKIVGTLKDCMGGWNVTCTAANPQTPIVANADIQVAVQSVATPAKKILLTIPVTVTINTGGNVAVAPVGTSSYTGTTAAGTTASGPGTVAAGDVATTANTLTVNLSNILAAATYATNSNLLALVGTGSYNVEIGFSGIGLMSDVTGALFPLGTNVAGTSIKGSITIQ